MKKYLSDEQILGVEFLGFMAVFWIGIPLFGLGVYGLWTLIF